jgi:L-lysine 6-transaminase
METGVLSIEPKQVHEVIARYMQADVMDLVVDFERSQGSRLCDARNGDTYLDFFSCFATLPLGYNHPRICAPGSLSELGRVAALKPSNSDLYSVEMAEFVSTFSRIAKPDYMKYLFLIEGGTLAVENALKVAFDWKVRKNLSRGISEKRGHQVVHLHQAFHGRSGYTLSLTNTADPNKTKYFPKFAWPRVLNPKCTFPLEGEALAKVQRDEEESLKQIRNAIAENPDDIACLILEPIQGEGGDNHFRPEFHRELRKICDSEEILMIYDEVQTGLGATGKMWAAEHFVQPDIIAFGKKSQVCGIMVSPRVDEIPDNVFHVPSRINSTWGGNLVDMVRSRLYLEVYEEEDLVQKAARLGERLLDGLRSLQADFPDLVTNVRGRGLFCALDLPDRGWRDQFLKALFERKLIMLGCGANSIRFRTALNIPEEDLMEGVEIIRQTLAETVAGNR